jgi:hypothetical protein
MSVDTEHTPHVSPIRTSRETDKLDTQLALAQGELTNPIKDKPNAHLKSKYTDVAGGLAVARPVLSKHKIALYQVTKIDGSAIVLTTRLAHAGQWIESDYPVCAANGNHQQMGASMTYAKRQSLFALIGIAGDDEDEDGKDAAKAEAPPDRKTENDKRHLEQLAEASKIAANALIADLQNADLDIDKEEWTKENAETIKGFLPVDQARVRAEYKRRFGTKKADTKPEPKAEPNGNGALL